MRLLGRRLVSEDTAGGGELASLSVSYPPPARCITRQPESFLNPALFGFLVCDKPPGMTSRDVVNVIQRRVRPAKVGHAGTLDPLAEGVLVVGIGPAVRLIPYVQQLPKHYSGKFRLGQSSVSGDLEGEIQQHPDLPIPSRRQLEDAAQGLVGRITQVPPAHSAIWVDGKRAYKRVRDGEQVDMPSREVVVHSMQVTDYEPPDFALKIVCGSGTYVRTLGIDLARAVGNESVMTYLQRTAVGGFRIDDALSVDSLRNEPLEPRLISPVRAVELLRKIVIDQEESTRLGNGLALQRECEVDGQAETEMAAVTKDGRLRAILRIKRGAWHPYRVFPLDTETAAGQ